MAADYFSIPRYPPRSSITTDLHRERQPRIDADFHGFSLLRSLNIRKIRVISGSIKINVDARLAITIVFLNLRFLLILLIFATHRGGTCACLGFR